MNKPLIGEPITRREDFRLLSGTGRYVDDVHLDGMLHAALFRSAWPHGRIRSLDVTAAAALPGVIGVFTHSDFGALKPIRPRIAAMPGFDNFLQLPLATDKVRYVGEPIAVVVAISPHVAEDAASLISAEIEELAAVVNWEAASGGSVLIHENAGTQHIPRGRRSRRYGCSFQDRALHRAASDFQRAAAHGVPMETRGLAAVWDAAEERMTVFGITKVPFFNRSMLASMLDLPESAVVMNVADAGGGFGVRGEFYPEDFLIPCDCAQAQSSRQMDRGPARAFSRDQPFARERPVTWRSHAIAMARSSDLRGEVDRQHRRLCARHRRHIADPLRAVPARAISDSELCLQGQRPCLATRHHPGPTAGQGASRRTSSASG